MKRRNFLYLIGCSTRNRGTAGAIKGRFHPEAHAAAQQRYPPPPAVLSTDARRFNCTSQQLGPNPRGARSKDEE